MNRSAVNVLGAMVEMISTGDVSTAGDVVAAEYLDHQGLDGTEMGVPRSPQVRDQMSADEPTGAGDKDKCVSLS